MALSIGYTFLIVSEENTVKYCKTLEAFFPPKFVPQRSNIQQAVASSLLFVIAVQGTYLPGKDPFLCSNRPFLS